MPEQPTAIVLALTATGLAVARDLAGAGWHVVGVDADATRPGRYSRDLVRVPGLSDLPLGEALRDALRAFASPRPGPVVVLPAADDAVEWCVRHRDDLAPALRMSSGLTAERAGVMLDKGRFAEACAVHGIDVPKTAQPESLEDVRRLAAEIGLPCIVKPRAGHLWRKKLRGAKLLVPRDRAELERFMADIVGDPAAVILQELVPGPESNLLVGAVWADEQGRVRHVLTARKHRQFPREFGSGSCVVSEDLPEVREASARIVEQLGYRGLCGTEFKIDPRPDASGRQGRLRLIEINPRPTLWYDLCRAAGTHLIRAHAAELADRPVQAPRPQRDGVIWRYLVRDAIALAQAGPTTLWRALRDDRASDTDAVLSWRDPLASGAAIAHTAAQALSHLRRGG